MNKRAYVLGVVMVAVTMAASVALRSFAEAAFLARYSARWLPYLFVAHAIALAISTIGYDRLTQRASIAAIDTGLLIALGAIAVTAPFLIDLGGDSPVAVVLAVVAVSSVANLAMWNCVAAAVAGRDARRALPRAGAAVTAGGAAAGLGAAAMIPRLGVAPIAYAAAAAILVVIVVSAMQRRALAAGGAPGATAPPGSAPTMSSDHDALVRWLFAAAVLEAAVATILEIRFNVALKATYADDDLAVAISLFYGGTNAVLLVLQAVVVPRLLVTRRLPVTLSIHPAVLVPAITGVAIAPGLTALAIARTTDNVLRGATSNTGEEVSLSALPPVPRARWKVLLRGAATPLGTAAMGALLVAAASAGIGDAATLAAVALAAVAIWLVVVRLAARRFLAALATPLGLRGLAAGGRDRALLDLAQLEAAVVAAGDASGVGAAIGRAVVARTQVAVDELLRHLDHDDPRVRAALFDLIARAPAASARREVAAALSIEDDDEAMCRGVRALAALGDASGLARARDRAGTSAEVAAAVRAADVHLGLITGGDAEVALRALAARDGAWAAAIARARPELAGALDDAIESATGVEVWCAAAGCGSARAARRLVAAVVAGEAGAAAAVAELSAIEVEALDRAVDGAVLDVDARVALARARAAGASTGALLWSLAEDADAEVRGAALRSLVGHVRAGTAVPATPAAGLVDRELGALEDHLARRTAGDGASSVGMRAAAVEHEIATRHALRRALDAAAIEAAATGRDPAPVVALGRHLVVASEAARKRALDVVQEVAATRPRLLDAIERYLGPPASSTPITALDPVVAARLIALRRSSLFADAPVAIARALVDAAREIDVPAGHVVFRAGDAGDAVYVVIDGELDVSGRHEPVAAGGAFGELALVDDTPRVATVTARIASRLLVVDRAPFQAAVARCPELGLALAARFAGWLKTESR